MIRGTVHDLRTPQWTPVDGRALLERIREERRGGDAEWTLTPWTRHDRSNRSYLIHSTEGGLYAVFLRRKDT